MSDSTCTASTVDMSAATTTTTATTPTTTGTSLCDGSTVIVSSSANAAAPSTAGSMTTATSTSSSLAAAAAASAVIQMSKNHQHFSNNHHHRNRPGGGGGGGGGKVPTAAAIKSALSPSRRQSSVAGGNRVKINAPYAYIEELAVSSPSERNWRGIFIALLVIMAVLGLIVFSIVLVSPPEEGPRNRGKKPTLEDVFIKLPPVARFNGTWISDNEFVYMDSSGGLSLYNAENLTIDVLVANIIFRQASAVDFQISSDLKNVLLVADVKSINEYSREARYFIYDRTRRIRQPLSPIEHAIEAPLLQYATWSPDGQAVAFVHENDIYYKPRVNKELVCRITNTGSRDVFNGVPDWLYAIEVLRTGHTLHFSADSQWLMWLQFNDTAVGEYKYPIYSSTTELGIKYPDIKALKYPKVATANPAVSVWVVNTTMPKYLFPIQLKPTNTVSADSYVTSAQFYADHQVSIVWLNRAQNESVIVNCRTSPLHKFNCTDFHIERESCGWTEPIMHPVFSVRGTEALARLPVKDGNNGHFLHACLLYGANNVQPLTHGAFEVTRIIRWDEDNHIIYAMATNENNPGVRHLFKLGDAKSELPWTCMTCQTRVDLNLTFALLGEPVEFNETLMTESMLLLMRYTCDYNNIVFSKSGKYFIQECLGPDVPIIFLVETATSNRLVVLDTASRLRRKVQKITNPRFKKLQVEIIEGYEAQVKLFLPPVLREYEDVTFPIILLLDSWPGSQQVSEEWQLAWPWYLASTRNFIVAYIDVRGSGYQGEKLRHGILNKLGTVDAQDQLAVLTYIRDTFKYVDRTKVCVVGRGYGGYISAMMMLQDSQQVINCSVSISPVSNWQYYNSYFTERYLGAPTSNLGNYEQADLTKRAGNMLDRNFLLVHGTADSRVKPQHAMMFAQALVEQEVLFHQLVYADEDYQFSTKSLIHMYREINQFFNDSFGPSMDEWDDGTGFFIQ